MPLAVCQWMCNSSCLHSFALHYRFFLYYNNFHCTILVEQANFNHCCQHSAADGQRQSEIWWHIARVAGNQVGIKFNILARNFVNFPSMWSSLNQSCLLLEYHMQQEFHKISSNSLQQLMKRRSRWCTVELTPCWSKLARGRERGTSAWLALCTCRK